MKQAEQEGVHFFEYLGVKTLAEARQLSAAYIRDKAVEYGEFWGLVTDQVFNTGDPYELFLQNKYDKVPILLGHTSTEFFSVPAVETYNDLQQMAHDMFGDDADQFMKLCHAQAHSIEEIKQEASVNGIEYAIRVAAQANEDLGAKIPMFYYNFAGEIPGWDNPGPFHSVDLWFFFETLAKCWRPFVGKHYDLARQMCNYWANFIRSGDPNGIDSTGEELPRWEPYHKDAPYGMRFADHAEFCRQQPSELMKFLVAQQFKNSKQ